MGELNIFLRVAGSFELYFSRFFPLCEYFWKVFRNLSRNYCLEELGKTRDQALCALGAKSGSVPGPEILLASVYTATSGTNAYTLYNKTG